MRSAIKFPADHFHGIHPRAPDQQEAAIQCQCIVFARKSNPHSSSDPSIANPVDSYLPLLLLPLPLSLSPVHLILLLVLTYILNRPCIYCSLLLVILFASSCHWSNRCFFDLP